MARMIGWIGLLVLALAVAAPAGAEDAAGLIEAARGDCAAFEDGVLSVGEGAVSEADLTGDGVPEAFVDYGKLTCSSAQSFWCGTGGCPLDVVVAGEASNFLARAWTVQRWDELEVLLLRVHPSECGLLDGLPPCLRAVTWTPAGWSTVGGIPE
jgi:hypothetical protein